MIENGPAMVFMGTSDLEKLYEVLCRQMDVTLNCWRHDWLWERCEALRRQLGYPKREEQS